MNSLNQFETRLFKSSDIEILKNFSENFFTNDFAKFLDEETAEATKTKLLETLNKNIIPRKHSLRLVIERDEEILGFVFFLASDNAVSLDFLIPNPDIKFGLDGLQIFKKICMEAMVKFSKEKLLINFVSEDQPFIRILKKRGKFKKICSKQIKIIEIDKFELKLL